MRATAFAASTSASSFSKQFHRVLLLSALIVTASLNSWAQNITVSPASLTFAKQIVGTTSSSKAVTISNSGASAQPIVIVMSGDYTETDTCSGSVPGSGSCTAKISFTPTLVGSIKGAASIYDNSKNLLAFVGITGTGEAPVTTAPTSLSFTGGTIGTKSAAKTFKITNNTTGTVTINSITTNVTDYTITTGSCLTTPLAAKTGNCTVSVTVTPTSLADDGAIIITDNAPNGLPLAVKLTSAATGGTTTPISLSKTSLTFKAVTGGISATQTITVKNSSASAVTMGKISASSDYAIVSNTCPGSLAAAGTCTFGITFDPTFVGSIDGAASVAYTGNNSPQLVNLAGTSLAPLTVAPASLTFTAQAVGTTSAAKPVKITNNNTSAVTLSSVVPSGDFQIQASGTTCSLTGGTLAAGKVCTLEIQFSPTIAGSIVGALTVTNTASPNPLLVPLSGTGTAPACPNNSLLKGNYAMLMNGWSSSTTAMSFAGSFVADGAGNISSGLSDIADQRHSAPETGTFTGTYCVGSNNLAAVALIPAGGSVGTFEAALDASDGNGHIIDYDAGSGWLVSGLLRKQDTSAFSTGKIKGNYATGTVGVDNGGSRLASAGEFTADGSGNLSGESDVEDAGTVLAQQTFTSSDFSVATTGRGTATITSSDGNINYVFYVVSASEMLMMAADTSTPPMIIAGQVLQQSGSFTDASLNGVSVMELEGLDTGNTPATPNALVGLLTTTGTGTYTISGDDNDGGTLTTPSGSGTYSVSSNGRTTLTGGGGKNPVLYLIGPNQAFVVGTDKNVFSGMLVPQSGSDFTNASLSGIYLGGTQQPVSWSVDTEVYHVNAGGNGTATITYDDDGSGGPTSGGGSFTYAVSSNGRVVVTDNGVQGEILYIISASQGVGMDAKASNPNPRLTDFHQ
jgi:hypothetical protein